MVHGSHIFVCIYTGRYVGHGLMCLIKQARITDFF